jgi:hypothetical protein
VELKYADKNNIYSKTQAEMILRDFFIKNQPKSFNIIHKGASAKGARYAICNLETQKGIVKVYLYLKETNGQYFISEIDIEEQ